MTFKQFQIFPEKLERCEKSIKRDIRRCQWLERSLMVFHFASLIATPMGNTFISLGAISPKCAAIFSVLITINAILNFMGYAEFYHSQRADLSTELLHCQLRTGKYVDKNDNEAYTELLTQTEAIKACYSDSMFKFHKRAHSQNPNLENSH
jgi:hypothetical protein